MILFVKDFNVSLTTVYVILFVVELHSAAGYFTAMIKMLGCGRGTE